MINVLGLASLGIASTRLLCTTKEKNMTVGQLRKKLHGVPSDTKIYLTYLGDEIGPLAGVDIEEKEYILELAKDNPKEYDIDYIKKRGEFWVTLGN